MAAYLSPVGNSQESDANGAPLSGGLVYTYAAGTSTPIATYTGSDGLTAQANPVVLNASGLPDSPIWLPAGQAVKLVIKDADGVTRRTVDDLTGINDPAGVAAASEWVTYTGEPTYINATSFSVEGDQTNLLQVGRRLKSTNTGGTVYSTISASSYDNGTALTTVTVTNDSGTLDAGLSAVAYGLLSSTNRSIPISNRAYAEYASNANLTTTIPGDDTIPQNTEGTEIMSVSLTPKSATSRVRIRFQGQVTADANSIAVAAAVFSSASASALRAGFVTIVNSGNALHLAVEHEYVPGTTSALTFSVRVGPINAATVRLNGTPTTRVFGGASAATLVVEEIAA